MCRPHSGACCTGVPGLLMALREPGTLITTKKLCEAVVDSSRSVSKEGV